MAGIGTRRIGGKKNSQRQRKKDLREINHPSVIKGRRVGRSNSDLVRTTVTTERP